MKIVFICSDHVSWSLKLSTTLESHEENTLFEIRQKFLRDIPHPTLILKQIKRISATADVSVETADSNRGVDLFIFLEEYLAQLLPLKLRISNCRDATELRNLLTDLYQLQWSLIQTLGRYATSKDAEMFPSVKQSDPFDAYRYQKELKSAGIVENEIKSYLSRQYSLGNLESLSALAIGVLRAIKILDHGG